MSDEPVDVLEADGVNRLVRPADVLPGIVHILPVANRPFFPAQGIPLVLDKEPWQRTIEAASETAHKIVGLVLVRIEDAQSARPQDFYTMGTACRIHRVSQQDDKLQILVEGLQRFRINNHCPITFMQIQRSYQEPIINMRLME